MTAHSSACYEYWIPPCFPPKRTLVPMVHRGQCLPNYAANWPRTTSNFVKTNPPNGEAPLGRIFGPT
jgi:hypothetical protein